MNTTCKLMMTGALLCASALPTAAQGPAAGREYPASALMAPCRDADSDSREAGTSAQIECEQYVLGFVDALGAAGMSGPGKATCPPTLNTGPEVRWALVRWVYGDYTARSKMPAAEALMQTLKESFPCK